MNDVVVLVPVLNRPKNVAPLVASFDASDTPGRLLFVVNETDSEERKAIAKSGADRLLVEDDCLTWPQKINRGYSGSIEPWILCAADDVHFHPGWFQATNPLRDAGYSVIGTNDLGNPRVLRGEHTTHPLIRRDYVEEFGTIDGPGEIVHEGYRHWACDDELVLTAKSRGAWAFCAESIVEHKHPYWNKAEWDDIYALGEQHAQEDMALWKRRRERIEPQCP